MQEMPESRYGHSRGVEDDGCAIYARLSVADRVPCDGLRECSNTGYHGRVAIQQVMGVDTQMEDLIARGATSLEIEQAAKSKGMTSLREDGWQKFCKALLPWMKCFA